MTTLSVFVAELSDNLKRGLNTLHFTFRDKNESYTFLIRDQQSALLNQTFSAALSSAIDADDRITLGLSVEQQGLDRIYGVCNIPTTNIHGNEKQTVQFAGRDGQITGTSAKLVISTRSDDNNAANSPSPQAHVRTRGVDEERGGRTLSPVRERRLSCGSESDGSIGADTLLDMQRFARTPARSSGGRTRKFFDMLRRPNAKALDLLRDTADDCSEVRRLLTDDSDTDSRDLDFLDSQSFDRLTAQQAVQQGADAHIQGMKSQEFQICITVVEARLSGANIFPVISVQVGSQTKYTGEKASTNCPYYNEYFVFDVDAAPQVVFDRLISLTAYSARRFSVLRKSRPLGSFKLDVGTVYAQEDHRFFRKWALLTDADDVSGTAKGYVKCTIAVYRKGEDVKPAIQESDDRENDIESNLLMPLGVADARQQARYVVRVHAAEELPVFGGKFLAGLRGGGGAAPYFVRVSFAGHSERTSAQRGVKPEWNEQIVITEMFPPLVRRIRLQLIGQDNALVATHFLDLGAISNEGFMPTFGPAFVNLYGAFWEPAAAVEKQSLLNEGLGEGVACRGRLLISMEVQLIDENAPAAGVFVEPCDPLDTTVLGTKHHFLLFGCVMQVSMLERSFSEKPVHLEFTIGDPGVQAAEELSNTDSPFAEVSKNLFSDEYCFYNQATPSLKPIGTDLTRCLIPFGDKKPCVFTTLKWFDYRWRLYHENNLVKLSNMLKMGLSDCDSAVNQEEGLHRLSWLLDRFAREARSYVSVLKSGPARPGATRLDGERIRYCINELERMAQSANQLKLDRAADNFAKNRKLVEGFRAELDRLAKDPQDALPDVIVWLVQGSRRLAYHRIAARELIFSDASTERGALCAHLHNFYLKLPGRKTGATRAVWRIQGQVTCSLWLGLNSNRVGLLDGLPKGYVETDEVLRMFQPQYCPPKLLEFTEKNTFELRCHLYQARSLLALDATGLSDPLARIIFEGLSASTQDVQQTINPLWNETLVLKPVTIYGNAADIQQQPPNMVVELFDKDTFGKGQFMGQVLVDPIVKLLSDAYAAPHFPPPLRWFPVYRGSEHGGELLGSFELIQLDSEHRLPMDVPELASEGPALVELAQQIASKIMSVPLIRVPKDIQPKLIPYRMEVLFWGVRNLRRKGILSAEKPRVDIECGGNVLRSVVIDNFARHPNFVVTRKWMDLDLPENSLYWPCVTIRCVDCRSFGRDTLMGTHVVRAIAPLLHRDEQLAAAAAADVLVDMSGVGELAPLLSGIGPANEAHRLWSQVIQQKYVSMRKRQVPPPDELLQLDWWSKYFASQKEGKGSAAARQEASIARSFRKSLSLVKRRVALLYDNVEGVYDDIGQTLKLGSARSRSARALRRSRRRLQWKKDRLEHIAKLKIYDCELEKVDDFNGFADWITAFGLYQGVNVALADDEKCVGAFKGAIKLAPLRSLGAALSHDTFFARAPSNEPVNVLVRVYVIKATDLRPADLNGRADPYLCMTLGRCKFNDKANCITKQLNPTFGKFFEAKALFPLESQLCVQVMDWDMVGRDDLIGETTIDLENRFYSTHRATCGIAQQYDTSGYNAWRDPLKPTQILSRLCQNCGLESPTYSIGKVRIGRIALGPPLTINGKPNPVISEMDMEALALYALHHWADVPKHGFALVPEHVETRPLFHPSRPGILQGRLEMWVDMFPMDSVPPPPIDISPRKPESFELRVVIWNTDKVVIDDDVFTGERMSDIYVKGWLTGAQDAQTTDVHYRSLTGEGNFNWRFVFPFEYLESEEKILVRDRESVFSVGTEERKIPPRLEIQIWDADSFSPDDYLGALSLDLTDFARGAKTEWKCDLRMLSGADDVPTASIFKQNRMKGWWPCGVYNEATERVELAGKLEMELELVSCAEAEANPAGRGRAPPQPLAEPNRPETSFLWLTNPYKSYKYILWKNYKWKIIKALILVYLIIVLLNMTTNAIQKGFHLIFGV